MLLSPTESARGNLGGNGDVGLLLAQPKHPRLHRDGKLDDGIVRIDRISQLLVAILFFQMLEIAWRSVAIAITDVRARHVDLHMDRPPAAVTFHIAPQTVADQVVPCVAL